MKLFALMPALLSAARADLNAAARPPAAPAAAATNACAAFTDHGFVAPPHAGARGLVVTEDGKKRAVVLVWLSDHRGGYALLQIDADTGASFQRHVPFPTGGDAPFFSFLSSRNRYYAHFGSHFSEYDPVAGDFTFWTNTAPRTSFSISEDEQGVIRSVTFPQSGLVEFDPGTRAFKDYGQLYRQDFFQYPSGVTVDDAGWVYWGIGKALRQIIAFDPKTGIAKPMIPEEMRQPGGAFVYRAENGKVYGGVGRRRGGGMFEYYAGEGARVEKAPPPRRGIGVGGSQGLSHRRFPDGRLLAGIDLDARTLAVEDPATGRTKSVGFKYDSEGDGIMCVAAAPDGTICGGAADFFSYNPKTGKFVNHRKIGQWNTLARQGGRFYVGCYTGGYLLEWDPAREWVDTQPGNTNSNPLHLGEDREAMNRPHKILALPDGKTVVMSGSPGYGLTGGGLVFWDNQARKKEIVAHTDILPEHTTMSMVALQNGKILGGTSTRPGSGGIQKAKEAELYIMDPATKKIEWHAAVFPGAQEYTDMCLGPDGLIYGLVGFTPWNSTVLEYGKRFFVFDPAKRRVIRDLDTEAEFGPVAYSQGPRNLFAGPDGAIYVLLQKGIARFDPASSKLSPPARSPVPIQAGGELLDGRIYFSSGSHLYSYKIPDCPGNK